MVVIKKRSNVIPVDFGEFKLEYNANDAGIENLDAFGEKIKVECSELQDLPEQEAKEKGYALVKKSWVDLFSEEDFQKVYEFAGEDSVIALDYLLQTIAGIPEEYAAKNSEETFAKYLNK
ncbi:hypothetical protein GRB29_09110 [Streptococcus pneumoniae]|nr:hypothetical protein [Streptococcus pneumoniae]